VPDIINSSEPEQGQGGSSRNFPHCDRNARGLAARAASPIKQRSDMAKTFFALERPRRISISITGYDAKRATGDQRQQLDKQRKRGKTKGAAAVPASPKGAQVAKPVTSTAALKSKPTPQLGLEPLVEAFGGSTSGEAQ
jgi:hypothetical protein